MASKVYGKRGPSTESTAPGRSAPLRPSFKIQPAPLSKAGPKEGDETPDPRAQENAAKLYGHTIATVKIGAGTGVQRNPLVGAGGVIQAHAKKAKKKKETTAERQARTGLRTGVGLAQHGVQVGRKPHDAGTAGAGGSSRAARHDHGNAVAIAGATQNAVQQGKLRRQDLQPSMVRTKAKALAQKDNKKKEKEEDDAPAEPKVSKKKLSKEAEERKAERAALEELYRKMREKELEKSKPKPAASAATSAAAAPTTSAAPQPAGGDGDGDDDGT